MSIETQLETLIARYDELNALLAETTDGQTIVKLSKEQSQLEDVVQTGRQLKKATEDMAAAEKLMNETDDADMRTLASEEYYTLKAQIPELENKVKILLLPKDEADTKNAILEVRAGTGGEEAALFAAELFQMYERYADFRGWKFEVMDLNETGLGGYKEAVARIAGHCVFASLKYESGAHRVQRVPETEANGRVHTSAATVAILPEAEEVDIHIRWEDIKMDAFRASGAGGQHVNKTSSAVRLTHMPTGVVVECQEERSQFKNRDKAMARLRSKLYDMQRKKIDEEQSSSRKDQVGSGDRSERIRTYNYPQSRVTDHRINLTIYQLDEVLAGAGLDIFIKALIEDDQLKKLAKFQNG